jgi:hypothetical protein
VGSTAILRSSNSEKSMSALGQKATSRDVRTLSALPLKADIRQRDQDVCFGPKGDMPRDQTGQQFSSANRPCAGPSRWWT